jgi:DNA-directed RNA polymerase subunit K/omega
MFTKEELFNQCAKRAHKHLDKAKSLQVEIDKEAHDSTERVLMEIWREDDIKDAEFFTELLNYLK